MRRPGRLAVDDMHGVRMPAGGRAIRPREVHVAAVQHHERAHRHLGATTGSTLYHTQALDDSHASHLEHICLRLALRSTSVITSRARSDYY